MSYQLIRNSSSVTRLADGACIPADPANRDWQDYQAWLSAGGGNVPVPAPAAPNPILDLLAASDMRMARVGEDILHVLVAQGQLKMSDLPPATQQHIQQRQQWRSQL